MEWVEAAKLYPAVPPQGLPFLVHVNEILFSIEGTE